MTHVLHSDKETLLSIQPLDLITLIKQCKVKHTLPRPGSILVSIPSNATVSEAVKLLEDFQVSSAPLRDVVTGEYGRFVEMHDILRHLIGCFVGKVRNVSKGTVVQKEDVLISRQEWIDFAGDIEQFEFKGMLYANQKVESILPPVREDPTPIEADSPLTDLLFKLTNGHRCVVIEDNQFGLVTQSDVIRYIAKILPQCDHKIRSKRIKDMSLGQQWDFNLIIKANVDNLAIEAFYLMFHYNVPCIPIVHGRKLVANLSVGDLKSVSQGNFTSLVKPIPSWILHECHNPRIPPIVSRTDVTFEQLLYLFATSGVHHVWLFNELMEPLKVVSMGDIIYSFYEMVEEEEWKVKQ